MAVRSSGKLAGLRWLVENSNLGFSVPPFEEILVEDYRAFKNTGELPLELTSRLEAIVQRFASTGVAVRSAALRSEDSLEHSGAGLYDTVFIEPRELSSAILAKAIIQVFSSVDNSSAVDYRQRLGIRAEEMEAIVQALVPETKHMLHGVFQSRMRHVRQRRPVMFSSHRRAVVDGLEEYCVVHFAEKDGKSVSVFENQKNIDKAKIYSISSSIANLIPQLLKAYGQEFEAEFALELPEGQQILKPRLYMLQIRPLTGMSDKAIKFPDKEPLFVGAYSMGAGEFVGPFKTTLDIGEYWDEPPSYALAIGRLEQTSAGEFELFGRAKIDYDKLTPNKKAIIQTRDCLPGVHALTIANERGILCVVGKQGVDADREFEEAYGLNPIRIEAMTFRNGTQRFDLIPLLGASITELGGLIHVVCNGLEGRVYKATPEEEEAFIAAQMAGITYEVTPLDRESANGFVNYMFWIKPSSPIVFRAIAMDFINFLQAKAPELELGIDAGNCYALYHPDEEYEVFSADYSMESPEQGVLLATERSSWVISNELLDKWFQEFHAIVSAKHYKPGKL
jgi:phosphoenolpyruvate synthase/pyruvate phosphate dikinase